MPPSPPSLLLLLFLSPLLTASIKVHWLLTPGSVEDDGGFHQMAKETLMLLSNDPLVNAYDEFEFVSAVYPGDFPESGPDLTYIDTVLAVGEGAAPGTDVFMLMGFDFDKLVGMAGEKYPDYYFIQVRILSPTFLHLQGFTPPFVHTCAWHFFVGRLLPVRNQGLSSQRRVRLIPGGSSGVRGWSRRRNCFQNWSHRRHLRHAPRPVVKVRERVQGWSKARRSNHHCGDSVHSRLRGAGQGRCGG